MMNAYSNFGGSRWDANTWFRECEVNYKAVDTLSEGADVFVSLGTGSIEYGRIEQIFEDEGMDCARVFWRADRVSGVVPLAVLFPA